MITLQNYTAKIPKQLQKKAEKNIVRECDENPKGVFTAYVDDGDDTFDVCLSLSSINEIIKDSCDCKSTIDFCIHKIALVIFIAKGKKIKYAVKTKKISKTETLLQNADPEKLKDWVREILSKNKDLELTFTHYFVPIEVSYTVEEVSKITTEAAKAIIKNKKNVDPTLLKKLIDVWQEVQNPFFQHYIANIADENAFAIFNKMIELCENYQFTLYINSNKIPKYIDSLLFKTIEPINLFQNEEHWLKAVNLFVNSLVDHSFNIKIQYLIHLKNIMAICSKERKQILAKSLCNKYEKIIPERYVNFNSFTEKLYAILEENELIDKYYFIFQPIRYNNDFNIKLIRKLIENKYFDKALDYCKNQISRNFNEVYSIPYYLLQKEILTQTNNDIGLASVVAILLPHTFDFNDYLFLHDNTADPIEKKNLRTKILSRAKSNSNKANNEATKFVFQLMSYEMKYKKMIDYIDSDCSFSIVLQFFDQMFSADKWGLLTSIFEKNESWFNLEKIESDKIIYPDLLQKMIASFGEKEIREQLQKNSKSSFIFKNKFVRFVYNELQLEK